MTNLRNSQFCQFSQRLCLVIVGFSFMVFSLVPALRAAEETSLEQLIGQMLAVADDASYDPQPLIKHGLPGMRAVLNQILPEVADDQEAHAKQTAQLIKQLGDDTFKRREAASAALRQFGAASTELLRQALEHPDPEVRARARVLLDEMEQPRDAKTLRGLQIYLTKQRDDECLRELARRLNVAMEARLDLTTKQKTLEICLLSLSLALRDCVQADQVQAVFLPLLKLKDHAPAIFVMQHNRGTAEYLTPLHRGALASDSPELIRTALRTMTRQAANKEHRPLIKAALEKYFDGSEESRDLQNENLLRDGDFLFLITLDAGQDDKLAKARQRLFAKLEKGNQLESLAVMKLLGNQDSLLKPMDPELLAAVKPHLKSRDAQFRASAARLLAMYESEGVLPLLLQAFADPASYVWQTSGESLTRQHLFHERNKSPIPALLKNEILNTQNAEHKARLEFLLRHLQQENPGPLEWPKQE